MQAVHKGQYEATDADADADGLSFTQKTVLVILPQALKISIPNIVSSHLLHCLKIRPWCLSLVELAKEGTTMLCVTHEIGFAKKVADRIIFMDEGQIIGQNEPDTFFNNPESDRLRLFLNQILTQ